MQTENQSSQIHSEDFNEFISANNQDKHFQTMRKTNCEP